MTRDELIDRIIEEVGGQGARDLRAGISAQAKKTGSWGSPSKAPAIQRPDGSTGWKKRMESMYEYENEYLDPRLLLNVGAGAGALIGGGYHGYKQHRAVKNLSADVRKHIAQVKGGGKRPTNVKMPRGVTRITNRDELKNWVHAPGNVESRIPVIGTPLKRWGMKGALKGYVPSTKKGWRGKVANWGYDPVQAGFMAPSNHHGTQAVLGHRHLPAEIVKHELGHAKDFKGMTAKDIEADMIGRQHKQGFWGSMFGKHTDDPTYQSEIKAWKNSKVKSSSPYQQNALKSYEYGHKSGKWATVGAGVGALAGAAGAVYLDHKGLLGSSVPDIKVPRVRINMNAIHPRNRTVVPFPSPRS